MTERAIEVGRHLQAADDAADAVRGNRGLDVDTRIDAARRIGQNAERQARRMLDGLMCLGPDNVALIRAQAVMAEMLAEDHPELAEVKSWLEMAAQALRLANEA